MTGQDKEAKLRYGADKQGVEKERKRKREVVAVKLGEKETII